MAADKKSTTHIESIRHTDKRANIPTEERREVMVNDSVRPWLRASVIMICIKRCV